MITPLTAITTITTAYSLTAICDRCDFGSQPPSDHNLKIHPNRINYLQSIVIVVIVVTGGWSQPITAVAIVIGAEFYRDHNGHNRLNRDWKGKDSVLALGALREANAKVYANPTPWNRK